MLLFRKNTVSVRYFGPILFTIPISGVCTTKSSNYLHHFILTISQTMKPGTWGTCWRRMFPGRQKRSTRKILTSQRGNSRNSSVCYWIPNSFKMYKIWRLNLWESEPATEATREHHLESHHQELLSFHL